MSEQSIIRVQDLHHSYSTSGKTPIHALRGVTFDVPRGEYLAIIGHNGSGKSTLAKHLNGLLLPTQGDVWVKDWNTREVAHRREVRSTVGMVFQSPDNQIVATIVEEDVAFGPENLGVPRPELRARVDWALDTVEMQMYRHRAPHLLSGGQKQRVALAGILAMKPEVLVLDESTALLDPLGREEVLRVAERLNREGTTVVAITHFMQEAARADRVVVMENGQIALQGTPKEVFAQAERLHQLQLDVPEITQLAQALHARDAAFPPDVLSVEEFVRAMQDHRPQTADRRNTLEHVGMKLMTGDRRPATGNGHQVTPIDGHPSPVTGQSFPDTAVLSGAAVGGQRFSDPAVFSGAAVTGQGSAVDGHEPPIVAIHALTHTYLRGTPLESVALRGVDMQVGRGEIVGIIGHTGSGKSTLIQHLNGLLRPQQGEVRVLDFNLGNPKVDVRALRRRVGLVFQFPEAQLFEQYVGDDVAFGPWQMGMRGEELRARVREAMGAVGLPFDTFKDRPVYSLSGGERRRAALAGVLALKPEILVLDEPTAGLDPRGHQDILERLLALHREWGTTLVMVSHNMEEIARLCDRVYVIADGATLMHGTPREIFAQPDKLRALGLGVPQITAAMQALRERGFDVRADAVTVQEAVNSEQ